jgi:hypothetical protein
MQAKIVISIAYDPAQEFESHRKKEFMPLQ